MIISQTSSHFIVSAPPDEAMMLLRSGGMLSTLDKKDPNHSATVVFRRDGVLIRLDKPLLQFMTTIAPTIPIERSLLSRI
jgi:hypothetical protein